ncbi:Iron-sulfur cluster assembly scaffold protein IscU 2 [Candidatus Lokiarchaeum ossiferum]|uniref:Iron-sulfur cluster assembly scaffold protein IscU 2 n=1 Tax=Candidatus Lokiarchaeum ossiferum TaxID=2951803 RepID=A0ABY6HPG1_9ARCH|nr:Iron-sulfur cluster assembly scaffold protein IscU 2 [Candidatus Lokiarchaeum sp. B-35]
MYSDKVMDHFRKPRNAGVIENPDAVGEVGNPACGDVMKIYLKINKDEIINEIKFQTFGCASAIACSSMVTELAINKHIDVAEKISRKDIADALDGLPAPKMHCSNLGADALQEAIKNYRSSKQS